MHGFHQAGRDPADLLIPKCAAVPVFIIKNNLRTGGISRDCYFEILSS